MTTTADALRFTATLLDSLPGLPPVSVAVYADHGINVQLVERGADEHTRAVAVDMLAAVLGLTPRQVGATYCAGGRVGDFTIDIYAPRCTVVRPAVSA